MSQRFGDAQSCYHLVRPGWSPICCRVKLEFGVPRSRQQTPIQSVSDLDWNFVFGFRAGVARVSHIQVSDLDWNFGRADSLRPSRPPIWNEVSARTVSDTAGLRRNIGRGDSLRSSQSRTWNGILYAASGRPSRIQPVSESPIWIGILVVPIYRFCVMVSNPDPVFLVCDSWSPILPSQCPTLISDSTAAPCRFYII